MKNEKNKFLFPAAKNEFFSKSAEGNKIVFSHFSYKNNNNMEKYQDLHKKFMSCAESLHLRYKLSLLEKKYETYKINKIIFVRSLNRCEWKCGDIDFNVVELFRIENSNSGIIGYINYIPPLPKELNLPNAIDKIMNDDFGSNQFKNFIQTKHQYPNFTNYFFNIICNAGIGFKESSYRRHHQTLTLLDIADNKYTKIFEKLISYILI